MPKLEYLDTNISLNFDAPVFFDIYPAFALRSVLGRQLRVMHCVARSEQCPTCPFRKTCAYAFIFETPIEKDSGFLPGRDRASHPFRIITDDLPGMSKNCLDFRFQLYGKGIEFLPHIIYAFREAGRDGLFRQRGKFSLSATTLKGYPLLEGDRLLVQNAIPEQVIIAKDDSCTALRTLKVICHTPVRFKTQGRFTKDFDAISFVNACQRRIQTLLSMYGSDSNVEDFVTKPPSPAGSNMNHKFEITERRLRWVDFQHWSGRQKSSMLLGGALGEFILTGETSLSDWRSVELGALLGVGKNASFGFGNISLKSE